jgi:hypothetical protein
LVTNNESCTISLSRRYVTFRQFNLIVAAFLPFFHRLILVCKQPTKDRARRPKRVGVPKEESYSSTVHVEDGGPSTSGASALQAPRNTEFAPPDFRTSSPLSNRSSDATNAIQRVVGPSDKILFRNEINQSKPPLSGVTGLIGKPLPGMAAAPSLLPPKFSPKPQSSEPAERRALPGLTTALPPPTQTAQLEERSPPRHTRIPSTGNRATVMEVAEAFNNQHNADLPVTFQDSSSISPPEGTTAVKTATPATAPKPRPNTTSAAQAERRKSNYEKYSAIILPPLREEATPAPSPVATLTRSADPAKQDVDRVTRSKDVVIQPSISPGPSFKRIDNILHFSKQ